MIETQKIMMRAAEKAGINTRNGDTYFLEERPVAGEKLLKMTKLIVEQVEDEIRERVEEELNAASYYQRDEEESQADEERDENPEPEVEPEDAKLSEELLLTIEKAFEKNNEVIREQANRMVAKLEEIKEVSEKKTYNEPQREFKERVRRGLSKPEYDNNPREYDSKKLQQEILKQLKLSKQYRGAANAPKVVEKLFEEPTLELSTREIANRTRTSINSIRDTVKYINENVDTIEYVVTMENGRKKGILKVVEKKWK